MANEAGVNLDYAGPCIIPISCTAKVEKTCVSSPNCGTVPYAITVYNTTPDQEIYCTVSDSNPNMVSWIPAIPIPPDTITIAQGSTFTFDGIYTCDPQVCPFTLDPNTVTIACKNAAGVTCTADPSGALEDTAQDCKCEKVEEPKACWLTAGGVKFEPLVGKKMATADNGGSGPVISIGGNVNPACSPTAGDGGNWTHLDHKAKLFFQGRQIEVAECGNMHDEGIEPIYDGSTSPKTPWNYIEFQGTGTLKGILGNKAVYPDKVCFYARAEDRSEPGSKEKLGSAFIDRYWIRVDDCAGTELYRFGYDYPNPTTICADDSFACTDTIAISGGNLQIHVSSCDSYN
jgi:hypothetical protein